MRLFYFDVALDSIALAVDGCSQLGHVLLVSSETHVFEGLLLGLCLPFCYYSFYTLAQVLLGTH